jgi:hypothetical protein
VVDWTNAAGNYSLDDAANWSTLTRPGLLDIVHINAPTSQPLIGTSLSAQSLDSNAPLVLSGPLTVAQSGSFLNTLNVGGTVSLGADGLLTALAATTLTGGLDVGLDGSAMLFGGGQIHGDVSIAVDGDVTFAGGMFLVGSGVDFTGAGWTRINGAMVTHQGDISATHLALMSGILDGTGHLSILEQMSWSGGEQSGLTGTTDILSTAVLTIEGSADKILSGRTINNAGTTAWTNGAILANAGSTFNNQLGALFDLQGAVSWLDSSHGSELNNAGLFRSSGAIGSILIEAVFNTSGSVGVLAASLTLNGGGSLAGTAHIEQDSLFIFAGGTFSILGPFWAVGAGEIEIVSPTVIKLNSPMTVESIAIQPNTELNGASTLTVNKQFLWTGGMLINGGTVEIKQSLLIEGSDVKTLQGFNMTIVSQATVRWREGHILVNQNSVVEIEPEGLFQIEDDYEMDGDGSGLLLNFGKIAKTGARDQGVTMIKVPLDNHGDAATLGGVYVSAGQLELQGGGESASRFEATSPGCTIAIGNCTFTCYSGTVFAGEGITTVTALMIIPDQQIVDNLGHFKLEGLSFLRGSGPFHGIDSQFRNLAGATFTWTDGFLDHLVFVNFGRMEIAGPFVKTLQGSTLRNYKDVIWSGGDISFKISPLSNMNFCTIENYGRFEAQSDNTILNETGTNGRGPLGQDWVAFRNLINPDNQEQGLFIKTGGAQNTDLEVYFINAGLVQKPSGNILFSGGSEGL